MQAINYFVAQKYIDALKAMAEAPNQKFVLMPMEATGMLGSLARHRRTGEGQRSSQPSGPRRAAPPPRTGG